MGRKAQKRSSFIKLLNDLLMIALSIGAMTGRYIENPIHETMGILFGLTVIFHCFQHLKWFKNLLRGTYRWRRILATGIILLLLLAAAVLVAHGAMMSRTWLSFMGFKSSLTIRQIHTTAAYWMLVLTGIHIGIHWPRVSGMLEQLIGFRQESIGLQYSLRVLEIFVVIAGISAFSDREISARLFMVYAFDFWNRELPLIRVLFSYLSITGCFAIATNKIWHLLRKFKIKNATKSKTTRHES